MKLRRFHLEIGLSCLDQVLDVGSTQRVRYRCYVRYFRIFYPMHDGPYHPGARHPLAGYMLSPVASATQRQGTSQRSLEETMGMRYQYETHLAPLDGFP